MNMIITITMVGWSYPLMCR